MPFFAVGFLVGSLISQTMRTLVDKCIVPEEDGAGDDDLSAPEPAGHDAPLVSVDTPSTSSSSESFATTSDDSDDGFRPQTPSQTDRYLPLTDVPCSPLRTPSSSESSVASSGTRTLSTESTLLIPTRTNPDMLFTHSDFALHRTASSDDREDDFTYPVPSRKKPYQLFTEPCSYNCKPSSGYNTCWMDATLRAVQNLDVVKTKLRSGPIDDLVELSETPLLARLFLDGLHDPGRTLSSTEVDPVFEELCSKSRQFPNWEHPHPLHLLQPLLAWLKTCGVATNVNLSGDDWCIDCKFTASSTESIGPIYFLTQVGKHDSTFSLLAYAIEESETPTRCVLCGSLVMIERHWNRPDIITLYLHPVPNDQCGKAVTPSSYIKVPIDEFTSEYYRLSSVICQSNRKEDCGHLWTYRFDDDAMKEEDQGASVYPDGRKKIDYDAIVYFYVKTPKPNPYPLELVEDE